MDAATETGRPLAGKTAWIFTTGAAGMDAQTRGVADALGLDYAMKPIAPRGVFKLLAPRGPVAPSERFGQPGSAFAPPWPDIAIALGRSAVPYLKALRRRSPATFTLMMLDTRAGLSLADLIWVPQHDRLRGPNVVTTLTAPHSYSPTRIANLRAAMPENIAALTAPRVAVILGGKNAVYDFRPEDDERFAGALRSIGALGASFMITPSRRTHARLLEVTDAATRPYPRILWDGAGANPYPDFLAHAEAFVVTADSVNMTGEAAATGRPVLVHTPGGGSDKFRRFHEALRAHGATRPLPDRLDALPDWSYEPLYSADTIAREVERHWLASRASL
ncbi:DUF1022 domain-containing protein [Hyphomicrobium sulfonivorans]|uniref:DUF1022 domain-containing protein n=1 Tax=Hyphomicrobium sulfonivorans TaxID=121290 RepID=A0A120CTF7_HYPSL|nr:mitochondrial fission ELM1 family protein [Hyphomicrobium sulfonivorans]KWT64555.1 DUF1022 domain-containing protein [Hyphomicrobium sulfonivorans]